MKIEFTTSTLKDVALKEQGSIISGPFGSDIGSRFFQESGVPVIRGNNLSSGAKKFVDDDFAFVSEEKADELNAYAIRDDLVFTAAGTIGQVGIIEENSKYKKYVISNKQLRVRLDAKKVNPLFAYYWFSSPWVVKDIINKNTGSTVPLINLSIIKQLEIRLPKERILQDRIASVLSSLDSKIGLNNCINVELEAMARTLYSYWFVQFDFPDQHGKPHKSSGGKMEWSDELKREIPDGWSVSKLEDILRCNYGSIKQDEHYDFINYLDTSNLTKGVIDSIQYIDLEHETRPSRAQRVVNQNDILYSTVRPNQRHYGIIKNPVQNLIASTGFAQLTSKIEAIKNELIYLYLTSESCINHLQRIAESSVSSYPSISPKDLLGLVIALPKDEKILNAIGSILEPLFHNIFINHNQNQQLAELRDWLLPMLMNGQVRVN